MPACTSNWTSWGEEAALAEVVRGGAGEGALAVPPGGVDDDGRVFAIGGRGEEALQLLFAAPKERDGVVGDVVGVQGVAPVGVASQPEAGPPWPDGVRIHVQPG